MQSEQYIAQTMQRLRPLSCSYICKNSVDQVKIKPKGRDESKYEVGQIIKNCGSHILIIISARESSFK